MTPPSPSRRQALRRMGALALGLGAADLAWGATIVAVRVWPAADYTRVTIESDQALVARQSLAENPPRLVIDIDALELSPALRELVGKVRADDPYIAGVRIGQYQARVVRLVIDLKQAVQPQQLTLAPVAAYQHRLVFDLHPTEAPDPLLALIRDRETASAQAAQQVQDALGEFIGRIDKPVQRPAAPAPAPLLAERPGPPAIPTLGASPPPQTTPAPPPAALLPDEQRRIDRLVVVAIDAGHGGEDPGAIGPTGLREKDVVLTVALKLRDRLNSVPGMRAMLTSDASTSCRCTSGCARPGGCRPTCWCRSTPTPSSRRRRAGRRCLRCRPTAPPAQPHAGWPTRRMPPTAWVAWASPASRMRRCCTPWPT